MIVSKIINRLDLSDDFWAQFGVQNKKIKKQVELHEIESINNPNILTISMNPKEYFEKYRDKRINKKHKGLKRDTPGMDFQAYSSRLSFLHEFCDKQKQNKMKQKRFQVVNNSMQMVSVSKTQFAGLTLIRLEFLKVVFPGVKWGGGGGPPNRIPPPPPLPTLHISRRTFPISIKLYTIIKQSI